MADASFSTTDLGLAIHLRTHKELTYRIEQLAPNKRVFHFEPAKEAEKIARDYLFVKERLKEEMFNV